MNWFAVRRPGGIRTPLNLECRISLPSWKPVGSVEMTPSGRLFLSTTAQIPQAVQIRVDWVARGTDADTAASELAYMTDLLDDADRLYHGDWYLSVLRLEEATEPVRGFGDLKYTGAHVYTVTTPIFTHEDGRTSRTPSAPTGEA